MTIRGDSPTNGVCGATIITGPFQRFWLHDVDGKWSQEFETDKDGRCPVWAPPTVREVRLEFASKGTGR